MRRRLVFLQAAGLVLGLVVVGTFLWPPVYQSDAEILVQDNRAQFLVSPDIQDNSTERPQVVANPVSEQDLNSERELVTSMFLIKQAVLDLHSVPKEGFSAALFSLLTSPMSLPARGYEALHGLPEPSPSDLWAIKLASHLKTDLIKRSNVIEVTFTSHDARWSQVFLSRLLNNYLAFHARISHDPQAEQFFNEQAKILEDRLRASEESLRQYQVQTGITDIDDQTHSLIERISQLKLQKDQDGAQQASAQGQVAFLEEILKKTPDHIGKETRSVQNLALQQLKPQVMQMKAERAELLSRYQPGSLRIREIDAKLDAAQKILEHEGHLEVQESSTDLNPIWVSIETDLAQAKAQASSVTAEQTTLNQEISQGDQQLTEMANAGIELDRLERKVDTDKQAYMAYVRKAEEARTARGLNTSKILNISIAQEPMIPSEPKYPIVWLNLLGGLVLALAAGIGAAYWDEMQDHRIYSPHSVTEVSGLSTVAVIREEA
jgi:polysaccharide biosynthesis protein PslE